MSIASGIRYSQICFYLANELFFEQATLISVFPSAVDFGSLLKNFGDSLFY